MQYVQVTKEQLHAIMFPDPFPEEQGTIQTDEIISLAGGLCRSTKEIFSHMNGEVFIRNLIDDTEEEFDSFEEMLRKTNIGEALEKGAFYIMDWDAPDEEE